MVEDVGELRALLAGTALGGAPVRRIPVLETPETAFEFELSLDGLLDGWQAARDLLERTGRWPVAVANWGHPHWFNRFPYRRMGEDDRDLSPRAVLERAAGLDVRNALALFRRGGAPVSAERWMRSVHADMADSARRIGEEPPLTVIEAESMRSQPGGVGRALFEWEESRRPTTAPEGGRHLDWKGFSWWRAPAYVLLLPTTDPAAVPAYLSFYGADLPHGLGHEALICLLRHWHQRYGAEVVASTGTVLYLHARRPPMSVQQAYELAFEQAWVAPYTLGGPGVSLRDHARALLRRDRWLLHERP